MTDDRGSLAVRLAPLALGAVLVALVAAGAAGTLPIGDAQPDGDTVLDRVEQRYDSAETVIGDANVTVENATETKPKSVSFVVADPNKTRIETSHNGSEYVVGTNGSVAWAYDVSNDTVYVRNVSNENRSAASHHANRSATPHHANHSTAHRDTNVSQFVDENVTAELRRTTTLGDVEVYVLDLEPTNESVSGTATLWVDTEDYRVHKLRTTRGENVTTVDFTGVRFNASVHESEFRPPGNATDVTVVSRERFETFDAAQADTAVDLQRLDGDYTFGHAVVTRNGRTVALQRYTGNGPNVTLAATADDLPYPVENGTTVTVNDENATFVTLDGRSVVVWTDDGVMQAVVADLPRSELVDLAERVRG